MRIGLPADMNPSGVARGPEHERKDYAMAYVVKVDDNYDYMSGSYRQGDYATLEAAIEACKKIVDCSLDNLHEPGMTPGALYQRYMMFGDDPYILTDGPGSGLFSAWDYAKERSEVMCSADKIQS